MKLTIILPLIISGQMARDEIKYSLAKEAGSALKVQWMEDKIGPVPTYI